MYKYGNIEDAKPGDILEYQQMTKGGTDNQDRIPTTNLVIVTSLCPNPQCGTEYHFTTNDGKDDWMGGDGTWKLVLTKPGSEAKVGDKCILINNPKDRADIPFKVGDLATVNKVYSNYTLAFTEGAKYWYEHTDFLVLCQEKDRPDTATRRNLAFYKRSGEEYQKVKDYCGDPHDNIPTQKEPPMNPTITVTMTAKELAKYEKSQETAVPKSELESATKYITKWYNVDGHCSSQTTQSPKQATKELQKPNRLGWTFRTYAFVASRTTAIPTVAIES